jgi:hypothetical protein
MNFNPSPGRLVRYVIIRRGGKLSGVHYVENGKIGKPVEITERIYKGADCYRWREVYAWWPVKTISGKYIWGRKIYKQRYWAVWGQGFHMEPHVEYAELFDILGQL